jgi:hypothetical protein
MTVSRVNINEYVHWDEFHQRYDLSPKVFSEQMNGDVRAVMETVLRSWFIPSLTPVIKGWFEPLPEVVKPAQLSLW